jgi:hypothetical protein
VAPAPPPPTQPTTTTTTTVAEGVRRAVTDADGCYAFNDVTPGDHNASLVAESAWLPCTVDNVCIGSALAFADQLVSVRPGVSETVDWSYPYDDPPSYTQDYEPPAFVAR